MADFRDTQIAARVVGRDRHVVETPVVVDQRRGRRDREVTLEPRDDVARDLQVLGLGALPACRPPRHLPREEAVRLSECLQTDGAVVHGVELGERVHHHGRELAVRDRILPAAELRRHIPAHDHPVAPLHDEEGRADHARVVAVEKRARRGREALVEDGQHPVLATHVVRAGGNVAVRWAAQHVARRGIDDEVGEVRVAPGELPDLRGSLCAGDLPVETTADGRRVQLLAGARSDDISIGW